MHADFQEYLQFTGRSRLDKEINSLVGLIEGMAIDGSINPVELTFLSFWLGENRHLQHRHPYSELRPVVEAAISDGTLSSEERDDILWLCEKLKSTDFYDSATADIQRLHAVLAGIQSDGVVSQEELRGLSEWLAEHEHLRTCWPYDEVDSLVTAVLAEGHLDSPKFEVLQSYFSEFIAVTDNKTIVNPKVSEGASLVGLCAVCPEISFEGMNFCFTGSSSKYTRAEFSGLVRRLGGEVLGAVSNRLNYLIIGADGNPCWAYACYGRKVEKAVELRKQGAKILLVHENDFHDAVADQL